MRGTGRSSAWLGLAKIAKGEGIGTGDVLFDVVEGVHRLADRCVIVSADAANTVASATISFARFPSSRRSR